MKDLLTHYRESDNPPYWMKDYPIILITLLFLLITPLITLEILSSPQDFRSRAEKPEAKPHTISTSATAKFYNQIQITSN